MNSEHLKGAGKGRGRGKKSGVAKNEGDGGNSARGGGRGRGKGRGKGKKLCPTRLLSQQKLARRKARIRLCPARARRSREV